jgi:hypothetical protein
MSSETITPPVPTSPGWTRETRINIAVAETQGWTGIVVLGHPRRSPQEARAYGHPPRAGRGRYSVPDYCRYPAAWGPVMVRELARWETGEFDGETMHRCWWPSGDGVTLSPGPWCSSLPESACFAVLAKHGRTVEP